MTTLEQLKFLNKYLLSEMPRYKGQDENFSDTEEEQKRLFRCLLNVRPPIAADDNFLKIQDEFLQNEARDKGVIELHQLSPVKINPQLYLWQGDITRLKVSAIVNAANSTLLGCFIPLHGCVDNAIHSASGVLLRNYCNELMREQGHEEETGKCKISPAYNLPCDYVLHTVGPIIMGKLSNNDRELLKQCYVSCLETAQKNKLKSLAFCCISTGEFHFPNDVAAKIAVQTVSEFLEETKSEMRVIFNVFKEEDKFIYRAILGEDI